MGQTKTHTFGITSVWCRRGSRKFCQRGSNFDNVFLNLMGEGMFQISLIAGHHRADYGTLLNAGLVALRF